MVSVGDFRKLALGLPEAVEAPHFELASFRAKGRIFATLAEKEARAVVRLTPETAGDHDASGTGGVPAHSECLGR